MRDAGPRDNIFSLGAIGAVGVHCLGCMHRAIVERPALMQRASNVGEMTSLHSLKFRCEKCGGSIVRLVISNARRELELWVTTG